MQVRKNLIAALIVLYIISVCAQTCVLVARIPAPTAHSASASVGVYVEEYPPAPQPSPPPVIPPVLPVPPVPPPSCEDGSTDQGETDIDCGGPCSPCALEKHCNVNSDCQSGYCQFGACAAPQRPLIEIAAPVVTSIVSLEMLVLIAVLLLLLAMLAAGTDFFAKSKRKRKKRATQKRLRRQLR